LLKYTHLSPDVQNLGKSQKYS